MRRIIRFFIITTISILILTGMFFLIKALSPKPPTEEIAMAREAISAAWDKGAGHYTPRMMKQAQILYDSAMILWKDENKKLLLFRDFEMVRNKATEAKELANEARGYTEKTSDGLKTATKATINEIHIRVTSADPLFNRLPLPKLIREQNTQGKLLLGEAEISFKNGDYIRTNEMLAKAQKLLDDTFSYAENYVTDYFSAYPQWTAWVKATIATSKKNKNTAIIVDKFDRKCYVYQSGILKHTFTAELGKNWIGHKKIKGDNSTPEGTYQIIAKKDGHKTNYYKALLINYPSPEDKEEFQREKDKGNLPANSTLGSMIEIHGLGGKGIDWTNGCIAMTDKDMDIVYRVSSIGTPVTIIGSLKKLDEIINR